MDQDTPMSGGFGATSGSDFGATSGTGAGTGIGTTGTSGTGSTDTESGLCPHCGQATNRAGLEQFLGRLGINEDMINNLKSQFQNVDIDEYLNTAREYLKSGGEYLKTGSDKASTYAKENPGKVAAGVATLALGAGLLYAALNRDRS
jgi:hypothetical protein